LAKLDGRADQIIEKIVSAARKERRPCLTEAEKKAWDAFFYYQWKRVPDSLEKNLGVADFKAFIQPLVSEFETRIRPLTPEERESLEDQDVLERMKQNAKVMAVADPGLEVRTVLDQKGLGIALVTNPNKSFVVGSFPIAKLTHPGRSHLADPSVEVWFPIANDVAVTPALSRGVEKLVPIAEDRYIRHINASVFRQSSAIAGRSKELIESLANPR